MFGSGFPAKNVINNPGGGCYWEGPGVDPRYIHTYAIYSTFKKSECRQINVN